MRIGLIVAPWLPIPPLGYGGVETVVDHLARGLYAAGHDVMLCATGDSTCPVPQAPGLPEATGLPGFGPRFELGHVLEGYRALAEWEPDVVHDHSMVGPAVGGYHELLAIVTTNHTSFDRALSSYYRWVADELQIPVVAISADQGRRGGRAGVPIAATIHHGIDVDELPFGAGDGGYCAWLGRFDPCKGPDRAIAAALEAGIPIRLAAKTPGPTELEYFRAVIEPKLWGDDVVYVGEVDAAGRSELLAGARCLVNPISWPEPFGMVVIEALAHGTPVIATRGAGSMDELIEHDVTGYLAETVREFAGGIEDAGVLQRKLARKTALERFSTRVMVDAHLELYADVAR